MIRITVNQAPKKKRSRREQAFRIFCVDFIRKCCPAVTVVGSMNDVAVGGVDNKFAYLATLKKMGCILVDEPDLMLRWPLAKTLYIELKDEGEEPRVGQAERLSRLTNEGFPAECVDNPDDFIKILKLHGVPMRKGAIYLGPKGVIRL